MAKEILKKMEETINRLKNCIATKQFVNCYSRKFSLENQAQLELLLAKLKEGYHSMVVDINIQECQHCGSEEEEAAFMLKLINKELTAKGFNSIPTEALSIANALHKFSQSLDERALLIFHYFHDLYDEKEKNILRSLRKAHRNELSAYLRILILSDKQTSKWQLFPESNLDERHVAFFEY